MGREPSPPFERVLRRIQGLSRTDRLFLFLLLRQDPEIGVNYVVVPKAESVQAFADLASRLQALNGEMLDEVRNLHADLERRNPKPRLGPVASEVIRLRDSDPKKWSWEMLGRKYHKSKGWARWLYRKYKQRMG
jgi:hypothetical protein